MRKAWGKRMLALTLAAGLLAGCGSTGAGTGASAEPSTGTGAETAASAEQAAGEKEKVTFDVVIFKHALSKCDDFNEMAGFKMAEEATGVHINWIYIAEGANEKVNVMLTSDLPDAFIGTIRETQMSTNPELFLDLNQNNLLQTYAPHVYADYQKATSENMLESLTWPDGSIRSLATGTEVNYQNDAEGIMMINKTWLDQLGMDVPETTDELYEVLKAFRDNDMNGNGDPNDEIPLELAQSNWAATYITMADSWGLAGVTSANLDHAYLVQDGKIVPTLDKPEFRSYLEYMHKLMSEGLLDKEMFTQTNDQYFAKLKSGVVGVASLWTAYTMMNEDLAAQYVPMRTVRAQDDIEPRKTGTKNTPTANRTGFVITRDCENPERLLEWWDFLSSTTENKYTVSQGARGGSWDINEEGQVYEKTPEGLTADFTIGNYNYTYGMVGICPFIRADEGILIDKEESFAKWVRTEMVDAVHDQILERDEVVPRKFVSDEKMNERMFLQTELENYFGNFTGTAIMDGVTDESWAAHLEMLKTLQYYDWIQWWQDYMDGAL